MKKENTLSILFASAIFLLVSFQNCSKVAVAGLENKPSKVEGQGLTIVNDSPPGPIADDDADDQTPPMDQGEVTALCLKEVKERGCKKKAAFSDLEIMHHSGPLKIESDLLERVEDIRGPLLIKGKTSAARVQSIKNTRGPLVICGMTVENLEDHRGPIYLVNSEVKTIRNHRGPINLMNSEVGSTSDIRGPVREVAKSLIK